MTRFVWISSLLWEVFVDYAPFVMQDYLTSVWNLEFTQAAAIINIHGGFSGILPLNFLFLALNFLGNFATLVFSTVAYTLGILFIALSKPPVLAGATNTCETYQDSCIGKVQKALFYAGMLLNASGVASQSVSIKPFLQEQGGSSASMSQILGYIVVVIVGIAGAIGLPYIKPWPLRFGIPIGITFLAAVLFLAGCCSYQKVGPKGNPATARGEERIAHRMIPIWVTFIICGTVSSTGKTYFVEQASNMNRHLGAWKLPLQILLLIYNLAKKIVWPEIAKRFPPRRGVPAAMILSILCCIAAAKIETTRLGVIRKHGLEDKPNDTSPMSMFWLLPQFILLAGLDTLLEKSVSAFYKEEIQESSYLENTTKAVTSLGFFSAVVSVYVVNTVTEKTGSKTSWFQPTLNKSRLDYYYWLLAILSTANLLVFVAVALTFSCNLSEQAAVEGLTNE